MPELYQHPEYQAESKKWSKTRDMYIGDHDVMVGPSYLIRNQFERSAQTDPFAKVLLETRCARTRYFNVSEIVISFWTSLFLRNGYSLDAQATALLGDAEHNFDGKGGSLQDFIERTFENYLGYGRSYSVTDSLPVLYKSRAEELANPPRAFVEILDPLCVPDWTRDFSNPQNSGQFTVFRYEYDLLVPRTRATEEPKILRMSDEWRLENGVVSVIRYQQAEVAASGYQSKKNSPYSAGNWDAIGEYVVSGLDQLPISGLIGSSWVRDLEEESLRFHNLRSNSDHLLHNQGFERVFIIGPDATESMRKGLAEYLITFLPENSSVQSLPPTPTEGHDARVENSLNACFKIGMNMLRLLPADSRVAQSADSITNEKDNSLALVESTIGRGEKHVNDTLENYARFVGKPPGKCTIDADVRPEDVEQFLATYTTFRDQFQRYEKVTKATLKKAVKKLGLGKEIEAELIEEIDKSPIEQNDPVADAREKVLGAFVGNRNQENSNG